MSDHVNIRELLGNELLAKQDGRNVLGNASQLDGKYVALYFSAHWCPPCRGFTPLLSKTYQQLQAKGKPFEVVFVSADHNAETFQGYYSGMPWMALPFEASATKSALNRRFGVMGIPTLVILSPEGAVLNSNARSAVMRDPEGSRFPWAGEEDTSVRSGMTKVFLLVLLWVVLKLILKW